jgi:hypothetical protein
MGTTKLACQKAAYATPSETICPIWQGLGDVSDPPLANIPDDWTAEEVGMYPVDLDDMKREKRIESYRAELKKKGFEIQTPDDPDKYEDGGKDDE